MKNSTLFSLQLYCGLDPQSPLKGSPYRHCNDAVVLCRGRPVCLPCDTFGRTHRLAPTLFAEPQGEWYSSNKIKNTLLAKYCSSEARRSAFIWPKPFWILFGLQKVSENYAIHRVPMVSRLHTLQPVIADSIRNPLRKSNYFSVFNEIFSRFYLDNTNKQ